MLWDGEEGDGERAKEVRSRGSGEELRDEVGEEDAEDGVEDAGREMGLP
jgi:hypothetical protein